MDGSEMRALRGAMGMTQQEFATALGVNRLTIVQYERGYRHADKAAVKIPRHIELAALAVWAGFTSYRDQFQEDAETGAERTSDGLPENLVAEPLRVMAMKTLARRGITPTGHCFMFPWKRLRPLWARMDEWCRANRLSHKLHVVLNRELPGEGVAVVEVGERPEVFKLRWIEGD